MKYLNETNFSHGQAEKIGVLVANLGTPDDCDKKSVRRYLKQFLSDPRVVEAPRWLWWLFLNVILLNTRPKRTAKAYQSIWQENGSPLFNISKKQAEKLQQTLNTSHAQQPYHVELAMTYGKPSIESALLKLKQAGATKLLVLPLYPQYSGSTCAAVFDAVVDVLKTWRRIPEMRFINHYHDHPDYIDALAQSIKNHWATHQQAEKLVMSFHGIPQEYLENGDPYFCECHKTARLLANKLGLNEQQWIITFQSRLGPKQWLKPYTDLTLADLASQQGVKSVDIVCPGFSADCLETLEEIAIENKETFISNGGEQYHYIPCLNDEPKHIDMMQNLVDQHAGSWLQGIDNANQNKAQSQQRADSLTQALKDNA